MDSVRTCHRAVSPGQSQSCQSHTAVPALLPQVCGLSHCQTLSGKEQQLSKPDSLYSPLWAAPELLTGDSYGKAADVYR